MCDLAGTSRWILRMLDDGEHICGRDSDAGGMEELAVYCDELGCGAVAITGYPRTKLLGRRRK